MSSCEAFLKMWLSLISNVVQSIIFLFYNNSIIIFKF